MNYSTILLNVEMLFDETCENEQPIWIRDERKKQIFFVENTGSKFGVAFSCRWLLHFMFINSSFSLNRTFSRSVGWARFILIIWQSHLSWQRIDATTEAGQFVRRLYRSPDEYGALYISNYKYRVPLDVDTEMLFVCV